MLLQGFVLFVRLACSYRSMCCLLGWLSLTSVCVVCQVGFLLQVYVQFVRLAFSYRCLCGFLSWLALTSVCVVCQVGLLLQVYGWFVWLAFSYKCMCGLLGFLSPRSVMVLLFFLSWLSPTSVCIVCQVGFLLQVYVWFVRLAYSNKCMCVLLGLLFYKCMCGLLGWLSPTSVWVFF